MPASLRAGTGPPQLVAEGGGAPVARACVRGRPSPRGLACAAGGSPRAAATASARNEAFRSQLPRRGMAGRLSRIACSSSAALGRAERNSMPNTETSWPIASASAASARIEGLRFRPWMMSYTASRSRPASRARPRRLNGPTGLTAAASTLRTRSISTGPVVTVRNPPPHIFDILRTYPSILP